MDVFANAEVRGELSSPASVSRFIMGGDAIFTLQSTATGAHYTFRAQSSDDGERRFLQLLSGPDNGSDFVYVGMLVGGDIALRLTKKSKVSEDATAVKAFRYLERCLGAGRIPPALHVFHEGRCCRCTRRLTVPESIASGIGPECAKRAS